MQGINWIDLFTLGLTEAACVSGSLCPSVYVCVISTRTCSQHVREGLFNGEVQSAVSLLTL